MLNQFVRCVLGREGWGNGLLGARRKFFREFFDKTLRWPRTGFAKCADGAPRYVVANRFQRGHQCGDDRRIALALESGSDVHEGTDIMPPLEHECPLVVEERNPLGGRQLRGEAGRLPFADTAGGVS